ncbi:MAG: hypothetical protein RIM99_14495 [Cyclobacteriaceae bacterium]
MKLLDEREICGLIKALQSNREAIVGIPDSLINYVNSALSKLTQVAGYNGFEMELTGPNLAEWIRPLHFEDNLQDAINALEAVERAKKEVLELGLIKLHINQMEAMLEANELTGTAYHDQYKEILGGLEIEQFEENINIRYTKKIIDLVEFSKAAKLGAKLLFGITEESIDADSSRGEINRIRESLRNLLEAFREIEKKDQEVIIPISLKQAKSKAGPFLVSEWHGDPGDDRTLNSGLNRKLLEFDLTDYEELNQLSNQRIKRIGIRVVDLFTVEIPRGAGESILFHPALWNVEIQDDNNGYALGESSLESYKINPIHFKNIHGNADPNGIVWSRYDSIVNINANRRWKLQVNSTSHNGRPSTDVRDIVLYFHLATLN